MPTVIDNRTRRALRARTGIRAHANAALRAAERGAGPNAGAGTDSVAIDFHDGKARAAGQDIVDIWGLDSFPASDAPANW
jgi:hypothetical protein